MFLHVHNAKCNIVIYQKINIKKTSIQYMCKMISHAVEDFRRTSDLINPYIFDNSLGKTVYICVYSCQGLASGCLVPCFTCMNIVPI